LLEKAKIKIQNDLKSNPRNYGQMPKDNAKLEGRNATEYIYGMICEKRLFCGTEIWGIHGMGNNGPGTGEIL
jgi:hypothetical protein